MYILNVVLLMITLTPTLTPNITELSLALYLHLVAKYKICCFQNNLNLSLIPLSTILTFHNHLYPFKEIIQDTLTQPNRK